jgi:hypothetical protein
MPLTPISSTVSYCSASTLVNYCDWRPLAQLVSDTNTQVYTSSAQLGGDTIVAQALMTASGMIESAAFIGERYAVADLAGLTGASQAHLQWMVAILAVGILIRRRPSLGIPLPDEWNTITGQGGWLDRLAAGERIFAFQETAAAGLVETHDLVEADLQRKRSAITQARRYFGRRAQDRFFSPD